jgi:hypothetical protein
MRLYEFTWRRARDGHDTATTLVEGLDGASRQIEHSFRAAVRRELSRQLFTLDPALGFSAADFVLDWFATAKAGERGATAYAALTVPGRETPAGL